MERELPQDISFNDMNNGDIYLNTITITTLNTTMMLL